MASYDMGPRFDPNLKRPFEHNGKFYVNKYKGTGSRQDKANYQAVEIPGRDLIVNATLRRDEWKYFDEVLIREAESRLNAVADLRAAGLTMSIDGMSNTIVESQTISTGIKTQYSMDGVVRAEGDRPLYGKVTLPLPILHTDFDFNARELSVSRTRGLPLDAEMVAESGREIADQLERSLIGGSSSIFTWGGGTVHTYISFIENDNSLDDTGKDGDGSVASTGNVYLLKTGAASGATKKWTDDKKTGPEIVRDIINMKELANERKSYGPWIVYIPTAYDYRLDNDYKDSSASSVMTIRERLNMIQGIQKFQFSDFIPDDTIVMVEMNSRVVRWVEGMPLQNIEWDVEGGMVTHYKALTIQVPQIRKTYDGYCGVFLGKISNT